MVRCMFVYGGSYLNVNIPVVPRKDETMIMPDGVRYRVVRVVWGFEYEEALKAEAAGKPISINNPLPSWTLVDEALRAMIFLEK